MIATEHPVGVVAAFGGQTAIKLTKALQQAGVRILGTSADAIELELHADLSDLGDLILGDMAKNGYITDLQAAAVGKAGHGGQGVFDDLVGGTSVQAATKPTPQASCSRGGWVMPVGCRVVMKTADHVC